MQHELAGGRAADARDAEARQQALWLILFARLDGREDLVGVLLLADDALLDEFFAPVCQVVEVGNRRDVAFLNQAVDGRLAESFDVHGRAADEIEDVALELGRATRILALDVRGVRLAHGRRAADRASRADDKGLCASWTLLPDDFLDLRDDLA